MSGNISEIRETSHEAHGSSDIKAIPTDVVERYQGWEKLNEMRGWRDPESMERYAALSLEEKRKEGLGKGFDVQVKVYLSPEGKVRGYCEYCGSEYCIHAWQAVEGALKSVALDVLEAECGDFIEAIKLLKVLPYEEKKKVLQYRGIDTEDLEEYLWEIMERNQKEIAKWGGAEFFRGLGFYSPEFINF